MVQTQSCPPSRAVASSQKQVEMKKFTEFFGKLIGGAINLVLIGVMIYALWNVAKIHDDLSDLKKILYSQNSQISDAGRNIADEVNWVGKLIKPPLTKEQQAIIDRITKELDKPITPHPYSASEPLPTPLPVLGTKANPFPKDDDSVMPYWYYRDSSTHTVKLKPSPGPRTLPFTVNSQAEWEALPSGADYIFASDPSGAVRTKGARPYDSSGAVIAENTDSPYDDAALLGDRRDHKYP
jgi:hypothetical protein